MCWWPPLGVSSSEVGTHPLAGPISGGWVLTPSGILIPYPWTYSPPTGIPNPPLDILTPTILTPSLWDNPLKHTHLLPVDRMTDICENITFPQILLRAVIFFEITSGNIPLS